MAPCCDRLGGRLAERVDAALAGRPRPRATANVVSSVRATSESRLAGSQRRDLLRQQDRALELEQARRARASPRASSAARPDQRPQRHHQLLAERVDRRVGDLGEALLEVGVEQARHPREDRHRGVVAHREDRVLALGAHRADDELDLFGGVAEGRAGSGSGRRQRSVVPSSSPCAAIAVLPLAGRSRVAVRAACAWPFGAGRSARSALADGRLPRLTSPRESHSPYGRRSAISRLSSSLCRMRWRDRVDGEHLARAEAPLLDDRGVVHVDDADLGGGHDQPVLVDLVARRAQAVAVEHRADGHAVGEGERRPGRPTARSRQSWYW